MRADQKCEPKFQLFHQLTRITRDRGALRHDDRLDALAMAVAYWSEYLSRERAAARGTCVSYGNIGRAIGSG
jgi:hypothetical protein